MTKRRIAALMMALVMLLTLAPVTAWAVSGPDKYKEWKGTAWGEGDVLGQAVDLSLYNSAGWYYADENTTSITGAGEPGLTITGDVNLILVDGCDLTITGDDDAPGIEIKNGGSLTIYAGNTNSTIYATGKLTAKGGGTDGPGILIESGGKLIIHGVEVTAEGGTLGGSITGKGSLKMFGGHLSPETGGIDVEIQIVPVVGSTFDGGVVSKMVVVENIDRDRLEGVTITVSTDSGDYQYCTDIKGRATLLVPADDAGSASVRFEFDDYIPRTDEYEYVYESPVAVILEKSWIEVDGVTPNGTGVLISTNELKITFKEAMDTENGFLGTVSLDNGATLGTGVWSGDNTITYPITSPLGYSTTYTISIDKFENSDTSKQMKYPDTTHSFTTEGPPYYPDPDPEPDPKPDPNPTVKLTEKDLDDLLRNSPDGVMLLKIDGDLESLQLDIPLSWFMENLGATLLVYNESLGLMAITSENMIELAAQAYNGEEGGVTITVNGKEITLLPDTIMSYLMERGSIILSVTADGSSMKWYVYDSPLILGIADSDFEDINEDWLVAFGYTDDGGKKIIPQSLVRDGIVYMMTSTEGHFDIIYNPVEFDDVSGWWEDAIGFVAAREIMNGIGGGLFDPSGNLTRAQFVTMLMRMLDYEMSGYDPMPFSDIDPDAYYYDSLCKAASLGIVNGVGGGRFAPDAPVTRQDIFTMTCRALTYFWLLVPEGSGLDVISTISRFSDAGDISDYALNAMAELTHAGLIQGDGGMVYPHKNMSRAEAAQLMANIIEFSVPDYSEKLSGQS